MITFVHMLRLIQHIAQFTDTSSVQFLDKPTLQTHLTHFYHIQEVHSHAGVTRVHSVHAVPFTTTIKEFTQCSLRELAGPVQNYSTLFSVGISRLACKAASRVSIINYNCGAICKPDHW